ncbi:MAG: VF530 family protein [Comamonas sp.]
MQNPPETPPTPPKQANNPLHGLTLAAIVEALHAHYGWEELARLVPSVNSSLKFLRQTPWAREKVEGLYLFMLREQRRTGGKR